MDELSPGAVAALGGFLGGIVLGVAARWGRFCTLSSIEAAALGRDARGLRTWGLAIAVAIAGVYALDHAGLIELASSFYVAAPTTLAATVVGGLLFGVGMALVGTCGYGCLARLGGGDLKSLVTFLVMGIVAYATLRGALAYPRVALFADPPPRDAPASLAHAIAGGTDGLHPTAYAIALILALLCLSSRAFLAERRRLAGGLLVGGAIVWGWYVTGVLANDPFEPHRLESYTFSAPLGESLMYVMTMTGASLEFGIGAVAGVVAGAAGTSLLQGHFRWEACDDAREMRRQIGGGALMGVGSVTAFGCTIGQGVSAASLLAWSAPVALLSMFAGATLGLHYLVGGSVLGPLRGLFGRNG